MENQTTKTVKTNTYNFLVALSIVLSIAVIALAVLLMNKSDNEIVGVVNDQEITKEELYTEMKMANGTTVLNTLIEKKLVDAELEKNDVAVDKEKFEEEKKKLISSFPSEEAYQDALKQSGLSQDKVDEDIERVIKIDTLMAERIKLTEDELKTAYEEDPTYSTVPATVNANHILVNTEEEAKEVKAKLAAGEKFADLAKDYSVDDQNKDVGGALGEFGRGTMDPAFEEAAFALTEPGQVSDIVESSFGFHIIELVESKPEQKRTFEEVKETIKNQLMATRINEEYGKWVQQLKEEADIKESL